MYSIYNSKSPYQFVFIFDMQIDMDDRTAGKQDGPSPVYLWASNGP